MSRVTWKENTVISIETRKGVFVLAQMLISPYLMIYNIFRNDNDWAGLKLDNTQTLFCKPVTRQFLKKSNITKQPNIPPCSNLDIPRYWIKFPPGNRKVKVWENTEYEREFITLAESPNASLIEDDITVGGIKDVQIVMPSIPLDDMGTFDAYETTSVSIYPELNERLYLCYMLGKNIDPAKYISAGKELPLECDKYVDIIAGKVSLSELGY